MNADGTKLGYDIELTSKISNEVNIPVIASGGAGKPIDMVNVLKKGKASAVLAASIFHFGIYSIENVKKEMLKYNIPVRKHGKNLAEYNLEILFNDLLKKKF